jgi:arylsulfatase A-like enzyme
MGIAADLPAQAADTRPPNIILIMADDLGYEGLTCYGGTSYQTPRLDQMAVEGAKFNYCYSQPLCTPSRVKIMTGKSNFRNYERWGYLNLNETTFAHLLKAEGYKTCIAGKWQLRGDAYAPYKAGFDDYLLWQLTFTSYNERYKNPRMLNNGKMVKYQAGEYGPQLFTNHIGQFMEQHREEPFLVYYPMALTHRPYVPTPDSDVYEAFEPPSSGTSKGSKSDTTYFRDEVAYMDRVVGEIIDKVHELGIEEHTLILFTTDNGTGKEVISHMGEQKIRGKKGFTSEFGRHVPLIAYWKGQISAGLEIDDLVDFADFLPTMVEAAGGDLPEEFVTDGYSFLPQLLGQPSHPREWLFCHFDCGKKDYPKRRFVHNHSWKLYESGEIYHIAEDPWEKKSRKEQQLSPDQQALIATFRNVLAKMQ